jgi:hypothetical protein
LEISTACGEKGTAVFQRELRAAGANEFCDFLDEAQLAAAYLHFELLEHLPISQLVRYAASPRIASDALAGMAQGVADEFALEREASEGEEDVSINVQVGSN